jgi:fumarate hydratase subunit alpha
VRTIPATYIAETVKELVVSANRNLPEDVTAALKKALSEESSPQGRQILADILENEEIARRERIPLCQDTGIAIFLVDMGSDVCVEGGGLLSAIAEGTEAGYREGMFRVSLADPLSRQNTGSNIPPVVHLREVPGDRVRIYFLPKGGGAENMSRLFMLSPAVGSDGVVEHIVETVSAAGGKACPPLIVGAGIGGGFDYAPVLAKRALLREVGKPNPDGDIARLEGECLERINALGIGPMGLGGRITSLAVHIETCPCHIASLPVAVNLQCHSARHAVVEL